MTKFCSALVLMIVLSACSSTHAPLAGPTTTQDKLGKALVSPLNDFNLFQSDLPPVITEALKNPYTVPPDRSCLALTEQVTLLDDALGPDLDAIVTTEEQSVADKGSDFVQNEAVGSVERTINGVIPFRSWIRKFSGAEKHSKDVSAAIAAGVVRRAFLKGIGLEHGCEPPAAPLKHPATTAEKSISTTITEAGSVSETLPVDTKK